MPELKINDEVRLQYGPYRTTGTIVRITDAGAVVRPAGVASLIGYDSSLAAPNGSPLTLDPGEDFIGRAHWGSAMLVEPRTAEPAVNADATAVLAEQLREVVRPSVCGDGYDAKERTEEIVGAVLGLLQPQRCAPTEEDVATAMRSKNRWAEQVRAVYLLHSSQPTVAEAKADGWDERSRAKASYLGPDNGHYPGCGGYEDCNCGTYPNPYRTEAGHV